MTSSETDTTPVPERPEAAEPVEAPAPAPQAAVPPPPPEPTKPRASVGLPLVLALVALLISLGAAIRPLLIAPSAPSMTRAEGADLRQSLSQLESRAAKPAADGALYERVGALEKAVAGLAERLDRPVAGDSRVDDLDQRVKSMEDAVAGLRAAADASETAKLAERVDALSRAIAEVKAGDIAAEALVLASSQLRLATSGNRPFTAEFEAARSLGGGDPAVAAALDAIASNASSGVPTRMQLAERFAGLAGGIVRAGNGTAGGDWLDQVRNAVSGLITVRRQGGDAAGTDVASIVSRIEGALRDGDLARAVREAQTLEAPAADVAAPWLTDAKARLAVEEAVRLLGERAVERLTKALGPAETTP